MHTRCRSYALGIILLLIAAPAAAQWSYSMQNAKTGAWGKPYNEHREDEARRRAQSTCGRTGNGVLLHSAAKVVDPSGKETVFPCVQETSLPADDFAGRDFIERCASDRSVTMFVDCQCAIATLRAIPPEPADTTAKRKSPVRRASEACPADKTHIEREFYAQCLATTLNKQPVLCRCMASDVASKYLADPGGNIEYLRREAMKACWTPDGG